jgi:Amidohydrolase family
MTSTLASNLTSSQVYYKVEAYTASEKAGKILYENGITPVYVSDNPVLNSQHVVFEAAKAYANGLPYHVALAGVTSASAELLGLGERVGKIKEGFDADVVVWDSDPLSIAATPVQVWIDGAPQFENPVELKKPQTQPIKPDLNLQRELTRMERAKVIFTNITRDLRAENNDMFSESVNVIVTNSEITCIGTCKDEMVAATNDNFTIVELQNGYLTPSFTAFGSSLGLLEIDAEKATHDGGFNDASFPRAVDGLALDGKQLATAFEHGTIKAISAPSTGTIEAKGVSVGFLTGSLSTLDIGAIWLEEVAVHYPLTQRTKSPSISSSVGILRGKLLAATKPKKKDEKKNEELYSEDYYLRLVVSGKLPLVISVHKADTIAAIIRMKVTIDKAIAKEITPSKKPTKLQIVILGGAESYLVAKELAAANISVVLAPLLPNSQTWDERRSLPGAPLSNGTAIDVLLDAGVLVGIGVNEIWETRGLHTMAGWAWRNGEGRLTEKQALALVGSNIYQILDIKESSSLSEWLIWDGNPLEIGARLRGIGSNGNTVIWI